MRYAGLMPCVATAGAIFVQLGSAPALAGADGGEPDLRERVFFSRDAAPWPGEALEMVAVGERRIPVAAVGEVMSGAPGRGTLTVLAALGPARDGPLLDTGLPPWAGPRPLPWASGPGVPRPLSEPTAQIERTERRPPGPVPTLTMPEPSSASSEDYPHLGTRLIRAASLSTERDRPIMSLLPGTPKISSHTGDPIAALEFDEEEPAQAPQVAAPAFTMPFANGHVTSLFNDGRRHPAIDLGGALGSVVMATTNRQTVVFAGWRGGYGNAVIARDPVGRLHLYGHLRSITARVGQVLDQGTKLGHLGSTGHSTGPHVHYEVRDGKGGHINPIGLLFPGRVVRKGLAWADVHLPPRPTAVALVQPRPR